MTEQDFGGVKVNVCTEGCQGLFVGWIALAKLEKTNQGMSDALQAALKYPRHNDANRGPLTCPVCNIPMHHHLFQHDNEVNVDECYKCGSFFLDSGELNEIREHMMTPEQEEAYAQKLLDASPAFQGMAQEEHRDRQRADAIAHYTRFLRVSYYMTGK
jgi:Zn-finger nucleic acid-binding protein